MLFWAFMLIADLLVPLTMIFFGACFEKNAPKEVSAAFGYRTTMSMKNRDTWQFAHKYIGRLWKICGWLVLLISAVVMFFSYGKDIIAVSKIGGIVCIMQIVIMICTMKNQKPPFEITNKITKDDGDHESVRRKDPHHFYIRK